MEKFVLRSVVIIILGFTIRNAFVFVSARCLFTSGGPLAVRDGLTGTFYLKGIFSFGPESCNGTRPQVFTNIKEYMPWIIKNIRPETEV